jgi:hypothetical protein
VSKLIIWLLFRVMFSDCVFDFFFVRNVNLGIFKAIADIPGQEIQVDNFRRY